MKPLAGPDAELLALSAELDACDQKICAIYDLAGEDADDDDLEEAARPLGDRQEAILARLESLRATTPAGILARARSLAIHAGAGEFDLSISDQTYAGLLTKLLLRDALLCSGLPLPSALLPGGAA